MDCSALRCKLLLLLAGALVRKDSELRAKFNPVGCSANGVIHGISLFLKLSQ